MIDQKTVRNQDGFDLNPFKKAENLLGLNRVFKNSLYWNRAMQKHTFCYTFLESQTKNFLSFGTIESTNLSHQLSYNHLIAQSWLLDFDIKLGFSSFFSENYVARNYEIKNPKYGAKLAYLFSKTTKVESFFDFQTKKNLIAAFETLAQTKFGFSFSIVSEKNWNANSEIAFFDNKFEGNAFSPTGFQMLEGLQSGKNVTWRLLLQKKLNNFLDLNFNYQGRNGETNQTIHTGSLQLKAYF